MEGLKCMAYQCPIRMQCQRYIDGVNAEVGDGVQGRDWIIRCINQKKFGGCKDIDYLCSNLSE